MNKLYFIIVLLFCSCSQSKNQHDKLGNKAQGEQRSKNKLEENTIINLYDAFGKNVTGLQKDFGFSCILKFNGKTILFDAGTNANIFQNNIEALNIDLSEIDFAIASHAHFDHINGFDYLLEKNPGVKIYFPFDPFWGANIPFDLSGPDTASSNALDQHMQYFDGDYKSYRFDQTGRFWKANIEYIRHDQEIIPGINLITSSSPYMGYYTKYPSLGGLENSVTANKQNENDHTTFIQLPELSLSLKTDEGEVLIVGCSHSTVEQIVMDAKEFTSNEIALVYGGYHLLPYDQEILKDLAYRLKAELKVKKVAPAHCTGHLAFKTLQDQFQENYIFAGLGEIVNF